MTRAYQLAYIDLATPSFEQQVSYYEQVIGATVTEQSPGGPTYFSLGVDHHNVSISPATVAGLSAIGLRIVQEAPETTIQNLRNLGLSPVIKTDARPGVSTCIEVMVAGHMIHLLPDMEMPGPGFRHAGVIPATLGHIAVMTPAADALVQFCKEIGFIETDWFEGAATFLTCNRLHHVLNIVKAPFTKLHHVAFELTSRGRHHDVADFLATRQLPVVWGPSRHTAGHNLASYHFDPSRFLTEFYTDMDVVIPELQIFEPRPWHDSFPQRPRSWPRGELSTWHTKFEFDFTAV